MWFKEFLVFLNDICMSKLKLVNFVVIDYLFLNEIDVIKIVELNLK